jgi:hypothetical protein
MGRSLFEECAMTNMRVRRNEQLLHAVVVAIALSLHLPSNAAEATYWSMTFSGGEVAKEGVSYRASQRELGIGIGYGFELSRGYFIEGRASRYDVVWEPTFGVIPPAPLPTDQKVGHLPLSIVVGRRFAVASGFEFGVFVGGGYTLVDDIPSSNENLSSLVGLAGVSLEYITSTGLTVGIGVEHSTFRADEIRVIFSWGTR